MNRKQVKKLMILSPENYNLLTSAVIIPANKKLIEYEQKILQIMKSNLSDLDRLLLYREILIQNKNLYYDNTNAKNLQTQNDVQEDKNKDSSNRYDKFFKNTSMQTSHNFRFPIASSSPIKKYNNNRSLTDDVVNISDVDLISHKDHDDLNNKNKFYRNSMYENFPSLHESQFENLDFRDYSMENKNMFEKMRRMSNVNNDRDIEIIEDNPDRSYVKFKKRGSFSEYLIDRDEPIVDDEARESLKNQVKARSKTNTLTQRKILKPTKFKNSEVRNILSPKMTRKGTIFGSGNKQWMTYELF